MEVNQALLIQYFDSTVKKVKENYQVVCACILVVTLGGVGFFGYKYYKNKIRAAAYKDFVAAMQYYEGAVKSKASRYDSQSVKIFQSEADKWQQTEQVFRQGYEKYKNSEMAPVFLAFLSEALLNLGKTEKALEILNSFVGQVSSKEIKDCYKLKISLIKMDSKDAKVKDEGLKELVSIANDENNLSNEVALYQAGAFFWNQKNYSEARNYWQRLLVKTISKSGQPSVYAGEVREKLSLISAESL